MKTHLIRDARQYLSIEIILDKPNFSIIVGKFGFLILYSHYGEVNFNEEK